TSAYRSAAQSICSIWPSNNCTDNRRPGLVRGGFLRAARSPSGGSLQDQDETRAARAADRKRLTNAEPKGQRQVLPANFALGRTTSRAKPIFSSASTVR